MKNAVNIPTLSEESYSKLRAFIRLTEQMGFLYRQIRRRSVQRVEIAFAGKEIDDPEDAKILSVVALKGILEGILASGTVNFVNAILIAEQNGIDVRETISSDSGDYRNLIRMIVTEGDGQEFVIAGTVLERTYPRIVQIGEYSISLTPEGRLAYVPHSNVPGVIGRVGTIMGEFGVNISKMVTATLTEGRESIMFLGVDNDVPQAAIDRCLEIGEIHEFKIVNL